METLEKEEAVKTESHSNGKAVATATTTNFFSLILPFLVKGMDLTLTMRTQGDKLVVGLRPNYQGIKDDVIRQVPSLVLTHPSADLDESFFSTITSPMDKVQALAEAIRTWEESFTKTKTTAEKKMEGKPEAETAKASPKPTAKKSAPPAKAKKPAAPAKKPAAAKPKVDKGADLKVKYVDTTKAANLLLTENKFDEALKEAQKLLRLPTSAGSIKDSQALVKKIKDAKLQSRVDALRGEYDALIPDQADRAVKLTTIKKGLKGLMGVDAKHVGVVELSKHIHQTEEKIETVKRQKEANTFVDQAHNLLKAQEFGKAVEVLREVARLDPTSAKLAEIREDLNKKLGKPVVDQMFKTK